MQISSTASATATVSSGTTGSGSLTSDYQTFLRLMTTQMQEQDPLSPMDSTQFLSQLASFSAVEQQTLTNSHLAALNSRIGDLGLAQAASWVGREARAAMPALVQGGAPIPLSPQIATGADRAVLVVTDQDGMVVNRVDLPPDAESFEWEPADMAGGALPDGLYDLSVENYRDGERLETTTVELYGQITEIQGPASDLAVIVDGGRRVPVADVAAIRA
jgi:flagellar basal-body rod modification protein FlgD